MLRKPPDGPPERRKSDSANVNPHPHSPGQSRAFNLRRPSAGEWCGGGRLSGERTHGEVGDSQSQLDGKTGAEGHPVGERDQPLQKKQGDWGSQAEAIKLREWVSETLRNSAPPSHSDAEEYINKQPSTTQSAVNVDSHASPSSRSLALIQASTSTSTSTSIPPIPLPSSPGSTPHPRSRSVEKRRVDPSYEEPSELGLDLRTRPTSMHALNEFPHLHYEEPASIAVSTPSSPSRSVFQGGLKAFKTSSNSASRKNQIAIDEKDRSIASRGDANIKKKRVQITEDLPTTFEETAVNVDPSFSSSTTADRSDWISPPQVPTSSPQSNLNHFSATRVGLGVGIGALGASSDVNDLFMQGLDSRRSSLAEGLPSPALGFDGRSAHSRNASTASGSNPTTPSLHRFSSPSSGGTRDDGAQRMGMAPRLSKSTLLDLGRLEGLTPEARDNPYLNLETNLENGSGLSDSGAALTAPTSRIVSAGLEMGLGMNLATSALYNALPGTSVEGTGGAISSIAEPRYSHQNSVSMAQNFGSQLIKNDFPSVDSSSRNPNTNRPRVSVTTRELERPGRSALIQGTASRQSSPSPSTSANQPIGARASSAIYSPIAGGINAARLPSLNSGAHLSERGPEDEPPPSAIDRAETELARRRTTGSNNERGWQAGKSRAAVYAAKEAGKPRFRSGTVDSVPTSSRGASSFIPLAPAMESTSPISDSQRRGSAASSNNRDSPYFYSSNAPLHQLASDHHASSDSKNVYPVGSASASESNASNTTGSITTSAWYSNMRSGGSISTQAGTPSLGERPLLSPEAHSHMEDRSEFPVKFSGFSDSQPHLAHGVGGGRQSTASPRNDGTMSNAGGTRFGGSKPLPKGTDASGGGLGNALPIPGINNGALGAAVFPASQGALMGVGSGSHFGPGVRAKVSEVLSHFIDTIPISCRSKEGGDEDESDSETTIIRIAEYGALNSRSMQLMQGIITQFSQRANSHSSTSSSTRERKHSLRPGAPNFAQSYFGGDSSVGGARASTIQRSSSLEEVPSRISFCVTHEDSSIGDFRTLTQLLDSHPESYLSPHFQASHSPSLQNHIFSSFVARPFASRIAPPNSFHLGFSLMDLHWSHTPRNTAVSLATTAHAELTAFLTARSHEFRKGGIFLMAFIARSEDKAGNEATSTSNHAGSKMGCSSTPASPLLNQTASPSANASASASRPPMHARASSTPYEFSRAHPPHSTASSPGVTGAHSHSSGQQGRRDIWTTLINSLAPCLQRLVSCGMLKSELARALLILPMHPRTSSQTKAVLKGLRHVWKVEWSSGLGEGEAVESTSDAHSEDSLPEDGSGFGSSRRASGASETSNPIDGDDAQPDIKSRKRELKSEPAFLRLPHPAWKAFQAGTLSRVAFTEHMIQLYKNLFEGHFRAVLREKGKLSKGAVEFVIDSLWDVLYSRIEDQQPCPIVDVEIEVGICALRRV